MKLENTVSIFLDSERHLFDLDQFDRLDSNKKTLDEDDYYSYDCDNVDDIAPDTIPIQNEFDIATERNIPISKDNKCKQY
jgi:hypothetical protein